MQRVIITGDSKSALDRINDILTALGYEVVGKATSGKDAIELYDRLRPDIVLMDITPSGETEEIEAAGQIDERLGVPVVVLTGHGDEAIPEPGKIRAAVEVALKRKESERRCTKIYRDLIEETNDLVYVLDEWGNFKYCNRPLRKKLGYAEKDIIGKSIIDLVVPDSYEFGADKFQRQMRNEDIGIFEIRLYDADRNEWIIESRERFIRKEEGDIEIQGIGRDITKRKRAEETLRQSEEKYRTLVENMNEVVFEIDCNGTMLYVSPSIRGVTGYTPDEYIDRNIAEFVHPEDLPRNISVLKRYQEGIRGEVEFRIIARDGSYRYVRSSSSPIIEAGAIVGIRGLIVDVTETNKLMRQLIQSEKLASFGGVLSGAAHELNNPLTSIIGYSALLEREDIPQKSKNRLAVIHRESVRCAKIVSNLLTFAKERTPEKNRINVNDVIRESYELMKDELRADSVAVNLSLSDELPKICADPNQIRQVFINLISNAHDAVKAKGSGTLRVSSAGKGDRIIVEVIDDGIGIPEKYKCKIFDPFFTTKEVGTGIGLGLSTAYGIIYAHGGLIDVESEEEKYTKFTVELPVAGETSGSAISGRKGGSDPSIP
jgi:PAS domain S-box-containing protein